MRASYQKTPLTVALTAMENNIFTLLILEDMLDNVDSVKAVTSRDKPREDVQLTAVSHSKTPLLPAQPHTTERQMNM